MLGYPMAVDNFFVVGGACVATPNFVTTPTYYWIATIEGGVLNDKVARPILQK